MACSSCMAKKRDKVKITSTYVPQGNKVSNAEMIMNLKIEKQPNVSGQNKTDTKSS